MRLWEAIELGAAMKPQAFGFMVTGGMRATCSLGAAFDAAGFLVPQYMDGIFMKEGVFARDILPVFPVIEGCRSVPCPACGDSGPLRDVTVGNIIIHLNDVHRWTRTAIATWLRPIEEAWWAEREPAPAVRECVSVT